MNKVYAELGFTHEEIESWFNSQAKCKFDGKVISVKSTPLEQDSCLGFIYLKIKQEDNTFLIKENYSFGGCTFDVDLSNDPSYTTGINEPHVGDTIYGIMNPNTGKVLYSGKEYFDAYPEIPLCEGQSYLSTLPYMFSSQEKLGLGVGSIIVLSILILIAKRYLSKKMKQKK